MRTDSKPKPEEIPAKPIRVLLVADRALVRSGLRMLIESQRGLKVLGEASNRAAALEGVSRPELNPDVILLDLDSTGDITLDFLPELSAAAKEVPVLILSDLHDHDTQRRAIRFGAMGIVFKQNPPETLVKAIEKVHAGEIWFGRSIVARAFREMWHKTETNKAGSEAAKIATLTEREREVLDLICHALRSKQIAERLCISETTVRHHLTSIFDKLGVSDRFELVFYAYRHGLAAPPNAIPLRTAANDRRTTIDYRRPR